MNDNEDNVVDLPVAFHGDIDAEIILDAAKNQDLDMMMVIGYDHDGEFYMATSSAYRGDHLLLLQRGIAEVMDIQRAVEDE